MNSLSIRADIAMHTIERTFSYEGKAMLALTIAYPRVVLRRNPSAQGKINHDIQAQVSAFYDYASKDLYQQAIDGYNDARESGFPFHPYETVLQYKITYNQHCHLSLYYDQYAFTGGAHGNTIRASDSWNLVSGEKIPLSSFFPHGQDWRTLVLEQLAKQATRQMRRDPHVYFDEYQALIVNYFNEDSYYLTPYGIAIYYQQYEIAPYSTGIVVFTIPYKTLGWYPSC